MLFKIVLDLTAGMNLLAKSLITIVKDDSISVETAQALQQDFEAYAAKHREITTAMREFVETMRDG